MSGFDIIINCTGKQCKNIMTKMIKQHRLVKVDWLRYKWIPEEKVISLKFYKILKQAAKNFKNHLPAVTELNLFLAMRFSQ